MLNKTSANQRDLVAATIFLRHKSSPAPTPMSVCARLEVDWSKTFHIRVRKPNFS